MSIKPSNPKDLIGSDKLPLHLVPTTMIAMSCIAFLNGALKYGRANWRRAGVRSSIYVDAAKRHLDAWFEGEECDPDDGVPNLAVALACIGIIVDAQAADMLTDDRMVPGGWRPLLDDLTPHVKRLKALHADKSPRHWTIEDAPRGPAGNDVSIGGGEVPAPLPASREDEQPLPGWDSRQLVLGFAPRPVGGVEVPPGEAHTAAAGVAQSPSIRGTTCGDDYGVSSAPGRSHLYGRGVGGVNDH